MLPCFVHYTHARYAINLASSSVLAFVSSVIYVSILATALDRLGSGLLSFMFSLPGDLSCIINGVGKHGVGVGFSTFLFFEARRAAGCVGSLSLIGEHVIVWSGACALEVDEGGMWR